MAACKPFMVGFTGSTEDFFERIKTAINRYGGTVSGNASDGEFSESTPVGLIAGSFAIDGQTCTITIHQRPMVLPCAFIEASIRSELVESTEVV